MLSEGMKEVIRGQGLGFVATVCPDGTPNLSPKGTVAVWDDQHLVCSPGTIQNLASQPGIEINVVDPILRKGYRFKGEARVIDEGEVFERILQFYRRERGIARERVRAAVLMRVERAAPLVSPVYDLGVSEDEVAARWREHHLTPRRRRAPSE